MSADTAGQTTIGHSAADKLLLYGGLPLLGLALGFFLPRIADWAVEQPWLPLQGPLELISRWDGWWVVAIFTVVGALAGVLLAAIALEDTLKVTITNTDVEFVKNKVTTRVPRNQVAVAFLDGREIVLQDARSAELARERHDQLKSEALQIPEAFRTHSYPWSDDGDPHADAFRRWVEDDPDLPPAANAILRARSKAFTQSDKSDLRELRQELAKLDVAVKDKEKHQYWRAVP
ncbi:hypothetical protein GCM10009789_48110 [Kribbella sancticallisti]|uniref:DUF308 domain-containing protein n=1 Tax=Kribbella sancticallisti TaxID=460087 RepID=A0ABN2DWI1_9ACTN